MAGLASLLKIEGFAGISPGDPDRTYQPNVNQAWSLSQLPEGKILLAGNLDDSRSGLFVTDDSGGLDNHFSFRTTSQIYCTAVQYDGKVLVGLRGSQFDGRFTSLIRINLDGSLDSSFRCSVVGMVYSLVVDPNGNVLAGGDFTVQGEKDHRYLVRLRKDGSLDNVFGYVPASPVRSVVVQPDGRIVFASDFKATTTVLSSRIMRMTPGGVADPSIDYSFNSLVHALALQADGKIIVGGTFGQFPGSNAFHLARLNQDGSVDMGFQPYLNSTVSKVMIQADGKILVGGTFTYAGDNFSSYDTLLPRSSPARFNADGTLDRDFGVPTGFGSAAFCLAPDGKLVVSSRYRLVNNPSVSSLEVSQDRVRWLRDGSCPEITSVEFSLSTDHGLNWRSLGRGLRDAGAWVLSGLGLPACGLVRARALLPGSGQAVGSDLSVTSNGLTEEKKEFAGFEIPSILAQGGGLPITAADNTPAATTGTLFGPSMVRQTSETHEFMIVNEGPGPLKLHQPIVTRGANPADFVITQPATLTLGAGEATSFQVTFAAKGIGDRRATVVVASNDASTGLFEFNVQGTGLGAIPEIAVLGNGSEITNGSVTTDPANFTDMGSIPLKNRALVRTFTIENHGSAPLTLPSEAVTVSGDHAADFTITTQPASPIPPNSLSTFSVKFDPAYLDRCEASINILSNDDDEPQFRFAIKGTGIVTGQADASFHPDPRYYGYCLVAEPDESLILVQPNFYGPSRFARLNKDGTTVLDEPGLVQVTARTCAIQADGGIVIAGTPSTYGGWNNRNKVARLLQDGSLDVRFNQTANGAVMSIVVQADQKILLGGAFTKVGEATQAGLARLNADGTLDATYRPLLTYKSGIANVHSMALQANGKLVISGSFEAVNGIAGSGLARINPDGTLDASFMPGSALRISGANSLLAVQADQQILLASLQITRQIIRMRPNGSLDSTFAGPILGSGDPNSMVLQADGKILLGGSFHELVYGTRMVTRNQVARILPDGSLDPDFVAQPDRDIWGIALQADGNVLAGEDFIHPSSQFFFRFENDGATQQLQVESPRRIIWLRGGSAPEASLAMMDISEDDGTTWSPLGVCSRIPGGWELTGLHLPASGLVRARSFTPCGRYNGASGLVESRQSYEGFSGEPHLVVTGNSIPIPQGATTPLLLSGTDFGNVALYRTAPPHSFALSNPGDGPLYLSGSPRLLITGPHALDFTLVSQPPPFIPANGAWDFQINFTPHRSGLRSAMVRIQSEDPASPVYEFAIQGTGGTLEAEIKVFGNGLEIAAGDTTPAAEDGTHFGTLSLNGPPVTRNFTIVNSGTSMLNLLKGKSVCIYGDNAGDFTVQQPDVAALAPGAETQLDVTFSPRAPGVRSATLYIRSDDSKKGNYTFVLESEVVGDAPGLSVSGGNDIPNRQNSANESTGTLFPKGFVGGEGITHAFTITNTGTAGLILGGPTVVRISGPQAQDFAVSRQPCSNIPPQGASEFRITFKPNAPGSRQAVVTFSTNVVDANPFTFVITGLSHEYGEADSNYEINLTGEVSCIVPQADGSAIFGSERHDVFKWGYYDHLGKTLSSGELDPAFPTATNSTVRTITAWDEGKMFMGGSFNFVNQLPLPRYAGLNPDGSLDYYVNPYSDGAVLCAAVDSDATMLAGGEFTLIGGQNYAHLARLGKLGAAEVDFHPLVDGIVNQITVLGNREMMICGEFTTINGLPCSSLARLHEDGSLDKQFAPTFDRQARFSALQADGKILVVGDFRSVSGVPRQGLARLEADGRVDPTFAPILNGSIESLSLQADGKIILGGNFTRINGELRGGLARLLPDGSLDTDFAGNIRGIVHATYLQDDGSLLVAGLLKTVTYGYKFLRAFNEPATPGRLQIFNGPAYNDILWLRGGTAPEIDHAQLDWTDDDGQTWNPLGAASRVEGGWRLDAKSLPAQGRLRARGRTHGGRGCTSGSLVEATLDFTNLPAPNLILETGDGTEQVDGGEIQFGRTPDAVPGQMQTIVLRNTGTADLVVNGIIIDGDNPADFELSNPAKTTAGPGGSIVLGITYRPSGPEQRRAVLRIYNNAARTQGSFDLILNGLANKAPQFAVHAILCRQEIPTRVPLAEVLNWASDEDGGIPNLREVQPFSLQKGTVGTDATGITYTPRSGFTGLDALGVMVSDGQGGETRGSILFAVTDSAESPIGQAMILSQPDGSVAMLFTGAPLELHTIQRSTDLRHWIPLQHASTTQEGLLPYIDSSPSGTAFFRIVK